MLNKILATICLLVTTGNCFAQSNLVFFDADGDRMGSFASGQMLRLPENLSKTYSVLQLINADGIPLNINSQTGHVYMATAYGGYYKELDCQGQEYVRLMPNVSMDGAFTWTYQGDYENIAQFTKFANYARLHRTRSVEPTTSLQQIKWGTLVDYSHTQFLSSNSSNIDRCDNVTVNERWAMPLDAIEASSIGVGPDVDEGGWRYSMPFSTRTEENDIMFCNSFESCQP